MENLQITVQLNSGIAVTDKWSPNLDALLYFLCLDERGLANPNANAKKYIKADIPLDKVVINDKVLYKVSSPIYQVKNEEIIRYRKRWDNQDKHLNWGKKKAKVDTSQGQFKNWDLPLKIIETNRIDWYCVGDKLEIDRLLNNCSHLGKKRSQGKGQILNWKITTINKDRSFYWQGKIMRPIPVDCLNSDMLKGTFDVMKWAFTPPYFLPEHKAICAMP